MDPFIKRAKSLQLLIIAAAGYFIISILDYAAFRTDIVEIDHLFRASVLVSEDYALEIDVQRLDNEDVRNAPPEFFDRLRSSPPVQGSIGRSGPVFGQIALDLGLTLNFQNVTSTQAWEEAFDMPRSIEESIDDLCGFRGSNVLGDVDCFTLASLLMQNAGPDQSGYWVHTIRDESFDVFDIEAEGSFVQIGARSLDADQLRSDIISLLAVHIVPSDDLERDVAGLAWQANNQELVLQVLSTRTPLDQFVLFYCVIVFAMLLLHYHSLRNALVLSRSSNPDDALTEPWIVVAPPSAVPLFDRLIFGVAAVFSALLPAATIVGPILYFIHLPLTGYGGTVAIFAFSLAMAALCGRSAWIVFLIRRAIAA